MADFFKVSINEDNFIHGAARLLWAGTTISFPTDPSSIFNLSTYDAQTGWNDLGATKGGVNISRNTTEETYDVDQVFGEIDSRPTNWEQTVTTSLAEMTLERLQVAWEGGEISTSGIWRSMGVGSPEVFFRRRLAVAHRKSNNKLRVHVFRIVQKAAAESQASYQKTGDQQNANVVFRALADLSIADVHTRVQVIWDQS